MYDTRKTLGHNGECFVGRYLEKQGFTIHAYNYRQKYGEIDLIAQQGELLIFVEVKVRRTAYTMLAELVNSSKQRKIIKTAYAYLLKKNTRALIYRFDVALLRPETKDTFVITYIPNAFTVPEHVNEYL